MSHHKQPIQTKFQFKNLQPIDYLKKFNSMLQYMNKVQGSTFISNKSNTHNNGHNTHIKNNSNFSNNIKNNNKHDGSGTLLHSLPQLQPVRLSKYPLYEYYYQMEGVMEAGNGVNKKNNHNHHTSNTNNEPAKSSQSQQFQQYSSQFIEKHNKFVTKILNRLIKDNQQQKHKLQQMKNNIMSKGYQTQRTINNNNKLPNPTAISMNRSKTSKLLQKINSEKMLGLRNNEQNEKIMKKENKMIRNRTICSSVDNFKMNKRDLQDRNNDNIRNSKNNHNNQSNQSSNKHNNNKQVSQHLLGQSRSISLLKLSQYHINNNNKIHNNKIHPTARSIQNQQQQHNPIFKKLLPPKKYQQYHKKTNDQIDRYIEEVMKKQEKNNNNHYDGNNQFKFKYPLTERKHKKDKNNAMVYSSNRKTIRVELRNNNDMNKEMNNNNSIKELNNKINVIHHDNNRNNKHDNNNKHDKNHANNNNNEQDTDLTQSQLQLLQQQQRIQQFYNQISITGYKHEWNKNPQINSPSGSLNSSPLLQKLSLRAFSHQGDNQLLQSIYEQQQEQRIKQKQYGDNIDRKIGQMKKIVEDRVREVLEEGYQVGKWDVKMGKSSGV